MSENKLRLTTFTEIELLEKLHRAYCRIDELEAVVPGEYRLNGDMDAMREVDTLRARLAAYEKAEGELPEDPELPDTNGEAPSEKEWTELYNAFERTTAQLRTIATLAITERDEARRLRGQEAERHQETIEERNAAVDQRDATIAERDRLREELARLDEPRNMAVEISELRHMLDEARKARRGAERGEQIARAEQEKDRAAWIYRIAAARQEGAEKEREKLMPYLRHTHKRLSL